jgi:hypothetical protein
MHGTQWLSVRSSLRIHLLNLRDGSPYCAPPSDAITWDIPWGELSIVGGSFGIMGSRVVAYLSHAGYHNPEVRVLVWDRKTRDLVSILRLEESGHIFLNSPLQVLDLPTVEFLESIDTGVVFLDEFRIILATCNTRTSSCQLIVFNTLIPQGHPMSSQRLDLPPQYDRYGNIFVHVDKDASLGTLDRDGPIITDPTQAILVVKLAEPDYEDVLVVVRIQPLIERVCSTRTDENIPWDEWGRGAVILKNPELKYDLDVYVHGTHLVLFEKSHRFGPWGFLGFRTFDFGRRGCSALLLWEEGGRAERMAWFWDGSRVVFKATGVRAATEWDGTGSQGNGNFFHVSYRSHSAVCNGIVG